MATTTGLSFLSGQRSLIWVTGTAAALGAAYLISTTLQSPQPNGLHRSNAVRRARRHPAHQPLIPAPDSMADAGSGSLPFYGTLIPLRGSPNSDIISETQLRDIAYQTRPNVDPSLLNIHIRQFYEEYLDCLLRNLYDSPPSVRRQQHDQVRRLFQPHLEQLTIDSVILMHSFRAQHARTGTTMDRSSSAPSVAGTEQSGHREHGAGISTGEHDALPLQRVLYHIAEERSLQEGVVHRGISCNSCGLNPIRGIRWRCANCHDLDLCSTCEAQNDHDCTPMFHDKTHIFYKIRIPAPQFDLPKQRPVYPGRPREIAVEPNRIHAVKMRLGKITKMPMEEIDALWEQFTCLASSEWETDGDNIKWAIDREAFNQAFIPRYSAFKSKPNLIYDQLFRYYDTDHDGLIGFRAFVEGLSGMHTRDHQRKRKIVFDGYDIDRDGYISRQDMMRLFTAYYAIEKEASRNHILQETAELSVEGALHNIHSTDPLTSVFPFYGVPRASPNSRLGAKVSDQFGDYRGGSAVRDDLVVGDQDAPTSSRFTDKRFGGYEIPELDEDLGRDVLHQVTQRGFNELLDPFFLWEEEISFMASRTKGPRQKFEDELRSLSQEFKEDYKICQAISEFTVDDLFQYSGRIVSRAWKQMMNYPELLRNPKDICLTRADIQKILNRSYKSAEQDWYSETGPPTRPSPLIIDVWIAFIIRKQIMHEFRIAVTDLFSKCGWLDGTSIDSNDQTWPQFRPNSLANGAAESMDLMPPCIDLEHPPEDYPAEYIFVQSGGFRDMGSTEVSDEEASDEDVLEAAGKESGGQGSNGTCSNVHEVYKPTRLLITAMGPSLIRASWKRAQALRRPACPNCFRLHIVRTVMNSQSKSTRLSFFAMLNALERQNAERKGEALLNFDEFNYLLSTRDWLQYVEMWTECISL